MLGFIVGIGTINRTLERYIVLSVAGLTNA